MKHFNDICQNTADNYILPFLWMHGEDDAVILEELERIRECGIKAVCLESRPHPEFVGEHWWHDVDLIMEDVKKHSMKLWVLDDCAFPTGYANGKVKSADDSLRRRFIRARYVDVCGPVSGSSLILKDYETPDMLVAICARRIDTNEMITIPSSSISDGLVYFDVPDGLWRVWFISQQLYGSLPQFEGYINPLIRESTQILIDAVYEPHYARYGEDFGKTFAGFFSDEPGLYSATSYFTRVGDPNLALPWTPTLGAELEKLSDIPLSEFLVSLFEEVPDRSPACRYIYTDHISKLYRDNFTGVLGEWCRAHGVEYIGHVIEDDNSHARIGYSAGHYFRSLEAQDFGGIDIVLHQILPGMDEINHISSIGVPADGEFFSYMLAQLAESQAALEPLKAGRAMCEIFGAFGWSEGCRMMKWMTDFMLVRGINRFVPHAFSPLDFPDPDCPPHFYARGRNPQFRPFTFLMKYMNRAAHLLSGGKADAPVAIFYHGDVEWTTRPVMFSQVPARILTQAHIPFHYVSADYLSNATIDGNGFIIGGHRFSSLVIPYHQITIPAVAEFAEKLRAAGGDVCFVDNAPEKIVNGCTEEDFTTCVDIVPQQCLAERFSRFALRTSVHCKNLRVRHYLHSDGSVWMLSNEHPRETITTGIDFPEGSNGIIYNAMTGEISPLCDEFVLEPFESCFVLFGNNLPTPSPKFIPSKTYTLDAEWTLSTVKNENYPDFQPYREHFTLKNLSCPGGLSRFSGIIRYETTFVSETECAILDLGEVYETAEVFVNGKNAGLRLARPYRLTLDGLIPGEKNSLVIEVRNTLGHEQRDGLSSRMLLEPIGLIGPVKISY